MSLDLIKNKVGRFLCSKEPEVICISGRWGVGKTFAWMKWLEDAQRRKEIVLKNYSYVSLFGITSLDELRYSIFENSVNSAEIGIQPSLQTLKSNTLAVTKQLGKRSLRFVQQIPWLKNHLGSLGPAFFMSVREQIICIDDIERRGQGLLMRDVLGLVSNLKEQRRCKVILILNDEALEEDKDDFRKFLEKVTDASLKFAPTAAECAGIALDGESRPGKLLAEFCVSLGISNIRVIKRIERALGDVEPILNGFEDGVLRQVAQSLALLGWSVTTDEIYQIFKTNVGQALHDIINACFLFSRIGMDGQPTAIKELSSRAREALTRIGQESALNAARVKKYGINVQPKDGDDVAD